MMIKFLLFFNFYVKANVCSMIGYYTPYLFIVKFAIEERSIAAGTAVYFLSIIGT